MAGKQTGDLAGVRGLRRLGLDVLVNPSQPVSLIFKAVRGSDDSCRRLLFQRQTLRLLSDHQKLDDIVPGYMTGPPGIGADAVLKKGRDIPDDLLQRAQAFQRSGQTQHVFRSLGQHLLNIEQEGT